MKLRKIYYPTNKLYTKNFYIKKISIYHSLGLPILLGISKKRYIGNKYEIMSNEFLKKHNYKVAIKDVFSRNKKYKVFETWFVNSDINFKMIDYSTWKKKFYRNNKFSAQI